MYVIVSLQQHIVHIFQEKFQIYLLAVTSQTDCAIMWCQIIRGIV